MKGIRDLGGEPGKPAFSYPVTGSFPLLSMNRPLLTFKSDAAISSIATAFFYFFA